MVDLELSEFAKILKKKVEELSESILYPQKPRVIFIPWSQIENYSPEYRLKVLNRLFVESHKDLWPENIKKNEFNNGGKFLFQEVKKGDMFIKVDSERFNRNYVLLLKHGVKKDIILEFLKNLSLDAYVDLEQEKISFDSRGSIIFIGIRECKIPKNTNMHNLCEVMFERGVNIPIEWDNVAEKITGMNFNELNKKHMRAVKDTVYSTNDKIRQQINTKDDLFKWEGKFVTRLF